MRFPANQEFEDIAADYRAAVEAADEGACDRARGRLAAFAAPFGVGPRPLRGRPTAREKLKWHRQETDMDRLDTVTNTDKPHDEDCAGCDECPIPHEELGEAGA